MSARLSWLISHPEVLLALVASLRVLYAVLSRVVAPYPRVRAVVEGLAALGPDALRAVQQIGSAVLGRPLPSLDVRAPDDDREALRRQLAEALQQRDSRMLDLSRARDLAEARAATILELERQVLSLRGGGGAFRDPGVS